MANQTSSGRMVRWWCSQYAAIAARTKPLFEGHRGSSLRVWKELWMRDLLFLYSLSQDNSKREVGDLAASIPVHAWAARWGDGWIVTGIFFCLRVDCDIFDQRNCG